jgi:hypothetical protein
VGIVVGAEIAQQSPADSATEITIARSDPSGMALLKVNADGIVTTDDYLDLTYESSDCSGTPYAYSSSPARFPVGWVVPTPMRAFVPSGAPVSIVIRSEGFIGKNYGINGVCPAGTIPQPNQCCHADETTACGGQPCTWSNAVPLVEMDLSQLIPPFSIDIQ